MKITLSDCYEPENSFEFARIGNKLGMAGIKDNDVPVITIYDALGFDDAFKFMRLVQGHDREKRLFAVFCANKFLRFVRSDITNGNFSGSAFSFAIHIASTFAEGKLLPIRMAEAFKRCFRLVSLYDRSVQSYFELAATYTCAECPNDALYDSINSILDGAKYIDEEFFLIVKKRIDKSFVEMLQKIEQGQIYEADVHSFKFYE